MLGSPSPPFSHMVDSHNATYSTFLPTSLAASQLPWAAALPLLSPNHESPWTLLPNSAARVSASLTALDILYASDFKTISPSQVSRLTSGMISINDLLDVST